MPNPEFAFINATISGYFMGVRSHAGGIWQILFAIRCSTNWILLYFFRNIIALETAGANFQCYGASPKIGFYLYQIGFPGPAGVVFGVADLISGNCVFSANIANT